MVATTQSALTLWRSCATDLLKDMGLKALPDDLCSSYDNKMTLCNGTRSILDFDLLSTYEMELNAIIQEITKPKY